MASRQPLLPNDQLVSPAVPPEPTTESKAESKIDATKAAIKLLQNLKDNTDPWDGKEAFFSAVMAIIASGASASSAYSFVGKVFKNPALHIGGTIAAAPPAFALSFNANFAVWNRLFKMLPHLEREDVRRNALPLLFTVFSAVASFKVNWDAWKDAPLWLRIFLSAGRGLSALPTNGLFAVKMKRNLDGFKTSPEMQLLLETQAKLKNLAKNNPAEFIKVLSDSKLFERLINVNPTRTEHAKDDVNAIFESLFAVIQGDELKPQVETTKKSKLKRNGAYVLGALSAVPFYKTGQSVVPDFLGIEGAFALWTLGSVFGISSFAVNSAIAAIATADSMERLANRKCSTEEFFALPFKLYFLLGYSVANAGMAVAYPFLENQILGWIVAAINFLVYNSIGDMSFDNFFNKMENGYYSSWCKILENAKTAVKEEGQTLTEHFESLDTESQGALIRLLDDYLNWAFSESLINFFNYAPTEVVNELFDSRIKDKLNAYGAAIAPATPELDSKEQAATPAATPAITITIDQPTVTPTATQPIPARSRTRTASIASFSVIGSMERTHGNSFEPPTEFALSHTPDMRHSPALLGGLRRRTRVRSVAVENHGPNEVALSSSLPTHIRR